MHRFLKEWKHSLNNKKEILLANGNICNFLKLAPARLASQWQHICESKLLWFWFNSLLLHVQKQHDTSTWTFVSHVGEHVGLSSTDMLGVSQPMEDLNCTLSLPPPPFKKIDLSQKNKFSFIDQVWKFMPFHHIFHILTAVLFNKYITFSCKWNQGFLTFSNVGLFCDMHSCEFFMLTPVNLVNFQAFCMIVFHAMNDALFSELIMIWTKLSRKFWFQKISLLAPRGILIFQKYLHLLCFVC